jgi:hypothetical protein
MAFNLNLPLTVFRFISFYFLIITVFVGFSNFSLAATQITLAWDENSEPNLAGYCLYVRQANRNFNYNSPAWEGSETFCTIYNLTDTVEYCFVIRAYDTNGNESADSNEVCLSSTSINHAPVANAGSNQTVIERTEVLLDGSGSTDPDGDELLYQWKQTGGVQVSLMDEWDMNPSFTAPDGLTQDELLTFELVVSDREFDSLPDSVEVTVQTIQMEQTNTTGAPQQNVFEPTITLTLFKKGRYYQAKATVVVVDETGPADKGIYVEGQWYLGIDRIGDKVSGHTNPKGEVKLNSERFVGTGNLCFTAAAISESGITLADSETKPQLCIEVSE